MRKLVLYIISFVAFPGKKAGQMVSIAIKQLNFFVPKNQAIGANQTTQFYAMETYPEGCGNLKKPP